MNHIPDDVRSFIFEHVDSVTQLEILFLLHKNSPSEFDAAAVARELRANADSAQKYLEILLHKGLLTEKHGAFRYQPQSSSLDDLVKRLVESYKVRPHKVMELIFSTAKRARVFADAFNLTKNSSNEGEDNG